MCLTLEISGSKAIILLQNIFVSLSKKKKTFLFLQYHTFIAISVSTQIFYPKVIIYCLNFDYKKIPHLRPKITTFKKLKIIIFCVKSLVLVGVKIASIMILGCRDVKGYPLVRIIRYLSSPRWISMISLPAPYPQSCQNGPSLPDWLTKARKNVGFEHKNLGPFKIGPFQPQPVRASLPGCGYSPFIYNMFFTL